MNNGRNMLVLGLGSSGEAACELLRAEGCAVTALDEKSTPALQACAQRLVDLGVEVRLGVDGLPVRAYDGAVASPGLPARSPLMLAARERGLPVRPELELGWSRRGGPCVAVTGSNGKSTVVKWLCEAAQLAGRRAAVAGNYGPPVCRVVREAAPLDWLVLEASSFQLETAMDFAPEVGVLLNIQPNHLDRHGTLEAYEAAKCRLFARQDPAHAAIVAQPLLERVRARSGGRGRWTGFGDGGEADWRWSEGRVFRGDRAAADLRGTYFDNEVLGLAAAAVAAAAEAMGLPMDALERSARAFQPLPHRLQAVGRIDGVSYVDDSKATSLTAMCAALRMTPAPVRLIAGGLAKETDFAAARNLLSRKVAQVYLIGTASVAMERAWKDAVPCVPCGTLDAALDAAKRDAKAGDTVLLSPACASFDQFRNFEERGDRFAGWVAAAGLSGKQNGEKKDEVA